MRKLFILLFMATSLLCFGQNNDFLSEVSGINFYGVDFSKAKVFGAAETPADFKLAFDKINQLLITEAKKYDVGKKLKIKVNEVSLNAVNKVNSEIDPSQLMTNSPEFTLDPMEIEKAVKALPIKAEPGIGLVFVAKFLNKAQPYGSYQVVFFNTETKEIIKDWSAGGKARGIGLRNYWAYTVYQVIKSL